LLLRLRLRLRLLLLRLLLVLRACALRDCQSCRDKYRYRFQSDVN
jgi:hypothetical protein